MNLKATSSVKVLPVDRISVVCSEPVQGVCATEVPLKFILGT